MRETFFTEDNDEISLIVLNAKFQYPDRFLVWLQTMGFYRLQTGGFSLCGSNNSAFKRFKHEARTCFGPISNFAKVGVSLILWHT